MFVQKYQNKYVVLLMNVLYSTSFELKGLIEIKKNHIHKSRRWLLNVYLALLVH